MKNEVQSTLGNERAFLIGAMLKGAGYEDWEGGWMMNHMNRGRYY